MLGYMGFLGGSDSKESACNVGDLSLIPGLGRSPGGGCGNPRQYSCLENPNGQRSLAGYSPCISKSDMIYKGEIRFFFFFFAFKAFTLVWGIFTSIITVNCDFCSYHSWSVIVVPEDCWEGRRRLPPDFLSRRNLMKSRGFMKTEKGRKGVWEVLPFPW